MQLWKLDTVKKRSVPVHFDAREPRFDAFVGIVRESFGLWIVCGHVAIEFEAAVRSSAGVREQMK